MTRVQGVQKLGNIADNLVMAAAFSRGPEIVRAPATRGYEVTGPATTGRYQTRAVRPGNIGTYGELNAQRKVYGQTEPLDMDHQPSFAAQVAAREIALGRELNTAELSQLRIRTPAIASPRAVHQGTSPTYGGRNTPSRIAADAADLSAAQARDRAVFNAAMKRR